MVTTAAAALPRPDHVPAGLVRPYPYRTGAMTREEPHALIAAVHAGPSIFWADLVYQGIGGAWVPRRLEDLQRIYQDTEHFSSRRQMPIQELIGEDWELIPAEIDPPRHALYRAMLNPAFSPKRMAALEERMRSYARGFIVPLLDQGGCDFMSELAMEFPIRVFLELMGLPQEQAGQFLSWEHTLLHDPDPRALARAARAVVDYLNEQIEDRRGRPRDDLISYGLQVETDGRRLTAKEMTGFCFLLFLGGLDTVSVNMSWQMLHLCRRADHQAALRADPALIPGALDELMRAYAAVTTSRECVRELTIGEVTIRPGDRVMLPTYLAGRDPEIYDDPESVRLDRKPRHVSFGYGPHLCIGMHLARREMRIVLEEFLAHVPEFKLAPDADIQYNLGQIMSPTTVPIVWSA